MDQRSRISRQIITEVFFEILKEKPAKKMTVTEICERAGINRSTFYKYYEDVPNLLMQIERSLSAGMSAYLQKYRHPENSVEVIETILRYIRKNGDQYMALASEHGDPKYIESILDQWYQDNAELVSGILGRAGGKSSADTLPPGADTSYPYRYITRGSTAIVVHWLESGMPESDRRIAEIICRCNRAVIGAQSVS